MPLQDKKLAGTAQVHFSVTDGRVACGTVDLINGAFVATDTSGAVVGRFPTLHQAMRAFEGGAS